jgi:hypothetical protein
MKKITALNFILIAFSVIFIYSCKKDTEETPAPIPTEPPQLIFKFKFDSTQTRLGSDGQPEAVPSNHSAQSPRFNKMSAHYIELTPNANTLPGSGFQVYKNAETTAGGATAIDFEKSILAGNGEQFYSIPLKNVTAGTYPYLRISLAYQNYDINFRITQSGTPYDLTGTLASFIGYNSYIKNYKVSDSTVVVTANKLQGYWAFEWNNPLFGLPAVSQGQAPAGATTVPNPLFASSPIPQGSCLVTGVFATPLVITGNEIQDIVITVSLSTNKSFEWVEHSDPAYYEPAAGDTVVDMGIRGLIPVVN